MPSGTPTDSSEDIIARAIMNTMPASCPFCATFAVFHPMQRTESAFGSTAMRAQRIVLAAAGGLAVLAAAIPARADWDGWRRHEWRERAWREREWQRHHWHQPGYAYVPPPPVIYRPPPAIYRPPPAYYAPPPVYAPPPGPGWGYGYR
jgi:hypothetical protein